MLDFASISKQISGFLLCNSLLLTPLEPQSEVMKGTFRPKSLEKNTNLQNISDQNVEKIEILSLQSLYACYEPIGTFVREFPMQRIPKQTFEISDFRITMDFFSKSINHDAAYLRIHNRQKIVFDFEKFWIFFGEWTKLLEMNSCNLFCK